MTASAPPIIAGSYERVSTRMQGRYGFSLGAQHQSLEEFAAAQRWELPEPLRFRDGEDADASGADWDLPGLTAMMEAARRREFRVLIVPDLDRFARSLVKGLVLEEQLKKYGVRVVYQRVPTDDTPEGQLLKHQLLSFAEFERAKTTLRTTMGRRAKARTGRVVGNGGTAPYGHRFVRETLDNGRPRVVGLEPDPVNAPVALRIVRMARTASTWEIADALTAEGVPPPRGRRWASKTVHRIATDPTHVGRWRFADIEVPVRPLLSEPDERTPAAAWAADWHAAQRALTERRPGRPTTFPKDQDPYLLRKLLVCGHCGSALRAQPNRGVRYYVCGRHAPSRARRLGTPVCALTDVLATTLEAEAWRILTETLLDPGALAAGLDAARATRDGADQVRRDRRAVIDAEIAKQRRSLDVLAQGMETASAGEFLAAVMRRANEIEGVIARLGQERDALAMAPGHGLSEAEAAGIVRFAETARDGLAAATPADRRELYETLRLRARITADPDGVLLGRRNRYRIDWEAAIPLLTIAAGFLKRDEINGDRQATLRATSGGPGGVDVAGPPRSP